MKGIGKIGAGLDRPIGQALGLGVMAGPDGTGC